MEAGFEGLEGWKKEERDDTLLTVFDKSMVGVSLLLAD